MEDRIEINEFPPTVNKFVDELSKAIFEKWASDTKQSLYKSCGIPYEHYLGGRWIFNDIKTNNSPK